MSPRLVITLLSTLLLAYAASAVKHEAVASAAQETVRMTAADVRIEYPEGTAEWALRMAAQGDAAISGIEDILGTQVPGGTLRWVLEAAPGRDARGLVEVVSQDGAAVTTIAEPLPQMAQEFGIGYALGYARWLVSYAVAKTVLAPHDGDLPWWVEGGALYLTDLLARRERATTPVLLSLEAAWVRAAQQRRPVDVKDTGGALPEDDAARGKALATFRLIEAVYGADIAAGVLTRLHSGGTGVAEALAAMTGTTSVDLLDAWLKPESTMDMGFERVQVRDGGRVVRTRLREGAGLAVPVAMEIRCGDGSSSRVLFPATSQGEDIDTALECDPRELVLDPEGLLPDVNRSNNRHGFGDAEVIRRFFAVDEALQVGELILSGEVAAIDEERIEGFEVTVVNRAEQAVGLGFLVSAEWLERPERTQSAYFVILAPGEGKILHETLVYPSRGNGIGRIEARYWRAPDVDAFAARVIADQPEILNAYIVNRDAPRVPRRPRRGILTAPPTIERTEGTLIEGSGEQEAPAGTAGDELGVATPATDGPPNGATDSGSGPPVADGPFGVRLLSPTEEAVPIGDVTLLASVDSPIDEIERVEFFVNERRIGAAFTSPFRIEWGFPDDESVFVIRAVAVARDGRLGADTIVLDRTGVGFGSTVDLVTVHATVRELGGRYVRNLEASDFVIAEDGNDQELVQFDREDVPVATVLLLDTSSSMIGGGITAERSGARRLVETLIEGPNRAMVLGFNERLYLYSDFTGEVGRLNEAIDATMPNGSTALYDGLAGALRKANRVRGKRAVVVLTDGLDTCSSFEYDDVLEYIRQSDVLVYTIGLQLMHEGSELGDASGAVRRGVEQLRALAEVTGGAAYFPLRLEELQDVYERIADELSSQYALSYYPSNQNWDGRWRELEIRIPAQPAYRVQVRTGYYGVSPDRR